MAWPGVASPGLAWYPRPANPTFSFFAAVSQPDFIDLSDLFDVCDVLTFKVKKSKIIAIPSNCDITLIIALALPLVVTLVNTLVND